MPGYDGSLLRLAVDLTDRFMPAFDTPTGVPLSWVNLRRVGEGRLVDGRIVVAGLAQHSRRQARGLQPLDTWARGLL